MARLASIPADQRDAGDTAQHSQCSRKQCSRGPLEICSCGAHRWWHVDFSSYSQMKVLGPSIVRPYSGARCPST